MKVKEELVGLSDHSKYFKIFLEEDLTYQVSYLIDCKVLYFILQRLAIALDFV